MFLQELKNFSRENWWIYLLLIIALVIVYLTWKWNLLEIIVLFLLNFLWNLFVMAAMWNYQAKNNKIGSVYHLSCTLTFTVISVYWALFLDQFQYILWQITYLVAAIKAIIYYNFNKDIKLFNAYSVGWINILLVGIFLYLFPFDLFATIQAIWFSFVTTGLVSTNDRFRFFFSLLWVFFITLWSFLITWDLYINNNWEWLGISLWYFLLTTTVLFYHLKLLPKYLKK